MTDVLDSIPPTAMTLTGAVVRTDEPEPSEAAADAWLRPWVVAAAAVLLAVVAFALRPGGDDGEPAGDPAAAAVESGAALSGATTGPVATLLSPVLPGYQLDPVSGPLDLDAAAGLDRQTADAHRALLERAGFVSGHNQVFRGPGGVFALETGLRFDDAGGAARYFASQSAAVKHDGSVVKVDLAIPGAAAYAYGFDGEDGQRMETVEIFVQRDATVYWLAYGRPGSPYPVTDVRAAVANVPGLAGTV